MRDYNKYISHILTKGTYTCAPANNTIGNIVTNMKTI